MSKQSKKPTSFIDDPWKVGGIGLFIGFVIATFAIQAGAIVILVIGGFMGSLVTVLYTTYMANKSGTKEGKK